jgi:hypothetical protein
MLGLAPNVSPPATPEDASLANVIVIIDAQLLPRTSSLPPRIFYGVSRHSEFPPRLWLDSILLYFQMDIVTRNVPEPTLPRRSVDEDVMFMPLLENMAPLIRPEHWRWNSTVPTPRPL